MITKMDKGAATYTGLSTDTKPDNAVNGSTYIEIDTGDVYMYDAEGEQWCAI